MASHGSGSAQDVLDWTVNLHVIVKRFDVKVGEGRREIDSQHTGAQIKSDILLDEKFPIPGDMRRDAQNCLLYLRIKGRPNKVDNFDRLCTFGEVLKGEEVLLEILEPGLHVSTMWVVGYEHHWNIATDEIVMQGNFVYDAILEFSCITTFLILIAR